ncbi:MAG: Putative integral membrane protein [uncultured Sulfurovum sp.]|uniref:Integral membrane protein n=1 Tax=uncultured Sulfurovum sp. TaxID=269237 RepID=A0A6S6S8H6_9BACT|nr:MAG: Putative integral membrane protein [uncultured Sulfurovum sp.]
MAKKQRFRDTKQKRETKTNKMEKPRIPFATSGIKAKAFLTDIFMLLMPLLYISIYLIHDGLEDIANHRLEAWAYAMVPFLLILTLFMFKDAGRTPGARAQSLKVIDFHTLDKPSLFSIVFRNFSLLFSIFIPIFWLIPFFRKDKRMLHDFLSATCVIFDPNPPKEKVFKAA